jgi:16S rRNA (uracil1498-N3)-methyltransferase
MRLTRIYQDTELKTGSMISLDSNAVNHIVHVLRLSANDQLIIFNSKGGEFLATIYKINKHHTSVLLKEFNDIEKESPLKIHLAQVISRGEKMDFTIQKAVELGVSEITPLITARCGVKLNKERLAKKIKHWQGVIISACEQCGRNTLPILHPINHYNNWLPNINSALNLALYHLADTTLAQLKKPSTNEITLLVGPEGGLSKTEVKLATQNNFTTIKLGPRILRTETAALAAVSTLQSKWGDFL